MDSGMLDQGMEAQCSFDSTGGHARIVGDIYGAHFDYDVTYDQYGCPIRFEGSASSSYGSEYYSMTATYSK